MWQDQWRTCFRIVSKYSAEALAKIGGKNDLVAIEIWMNANDKEDKKATDIVLKCKQEIVKRMEKQEEKKRK